LSAAGNLTYTVGQGLNLLELCRERLADERQERRLKNEGLTTKQVLNTRLPALDDLICKFK
jgi:hypothetical protein